MLKHLKIILGFALLALVFHVKAKDLYLPFWGDELGMYAAPTFAFIQSLKTFLSSGVWPSTPLPHPPGLQILSLPMFWNWNQGIELFRQVTLMFFTAGLIFFYKILRFFEYKRRFALLLSILFFACPSYFTFSTYYTADTYALPLLLGFLFFILKENFLWAFILGLMAGLTRGSTVFVLPGLFLFLILTKKLHLKMGLTLLAPVLGLLPFLLWQQSHVGHFFYHESFTKGHWGVINYLSFKHGLEVFFLFNYKWLLIWGGLFFWLSSLLFKKRELFWHLKQWQGLSFAFFCGLLPTSVFLFHSSPLERYGMMFFPLVLLVLAYPLKERIFTLLLSLLLFVSYIKGNGGFASPAPESYGGTYDNTLTSRVVAIKGDALVRELEKTNPQVKVLAPEPYTALFKHQEIFGLPKRIETALGVKVVVTDSFNHAPLFFVSVEAD